MKLWTHHPSNFPLDDKDLHINPTMGKFWKYADTDFRYQSVLPILHERLGTDQILWCCTTRGQFVRNSEEIDLIEWEIELPLSEIVLYNVQVWENIVRSKTDSWDSLFMSGLSESEAANKNIGALVRLPLPTGCLTCHGQLPPRYLADGKENSAFREYLEKCQHKLY